MRLRRTCLLLAPSLTLPGCAAQAPAAQPHYVVGPAYQLGGVWRCSDVAAAESALDRAVRAGVTDAHVVVE